MVATNQIVVFSLDQRRYALKLATVERVLAAVEIEVLPRSPDIVLGIIDVRGRVIPVVNVRRRFRLPEREISLSDCFILAQTRSRSLALVVDAVTDVVNLSDFQATSADAVLPALEYVEGVVKTPDGLLLIHDLDTFLSLDETTALDAALTHNPDES